MPRKTDGKIISEIIPSKKHAAWSNSLEILKELGKILADPDQNLTAATIATFKYRLATHSAPEAIIPILYLHLVNCIEKSAVADTHTALELFENEMDDPSKTYEGDSIFTVCEKYYHYCIKNHKADIAEILATKL